MREPPARPPAQPAAAGLIHLLRKPQVLLPLAVVAGFLVVAFGVQPGGASSGPATPTSLALRPGDGSATATASATASPAASTTPTPQITSTQTAPAGSATSEVASARATETPAADAVDLSRQSTQCGSIQEQAVPLAVEQAISGVSVRASRAAVYPAEYFRCILMATGGPEAVSLAGSISKAQSAGATHAVLIDLWITDSGRDFAQLNLKQSQLSAAGQTFAPLATLGGRAEVVVSSGQGRTVTLVVTVTNKVGDNTGPMTLSIDAPLVGGKATAGKYQLFLPTP